MSVGLKVEIIGDSSKLDKTLDQTSGKVGGFGANIGGSALKLAGFATVAGAVALGIAEVTGAAAEDEAQQLKLTAAIEAAGAATGDYNAVVDDAIAKGQDRAFTDSQTRDALQSLVTATGDLTSATSLLGAAQDIARFAGVDLATAADAVAKAQAGQDGALRKLMPGLEKGATAADTLANATSRAAGQADKYANSAQGLQERGADAFGELAETIGAVFLPVLKELLPAIIPLLKTFGELIEAVLPLLTPILKLISAALIIVVNVIKTLVGWIKQLVTWVGEAIGALGRFLDSINPLKGVSLPSLPFLSSSAAGGPAPAGVSSRAGVAPTAAGSSGGLVVNVYTTGDGIEAEQAVVRALRRVTRLNGGVIPAAGFTG